MGFLCGIFEEFGEGDGMTALLFGFARCAARNGAFVFGGVEEAC